MAEVLPVGADMRPNFGQSRPWAYSRNRAAIRRLPGAQQLMAVNGRFRHSRRTAPDPLLPVGPWNSGRSGTFEFTGLRGFLRKSGGMMGSPNYKHSLVRA